MNQRMIVAGVIPTSTMIATNVRDPSIKGSYVAPFPSPSYKAGPLIIPQRVPVSIDYPGTVANGAAWEVFRRWQKPFLTVFSNEDPVTVGGHVIFQRDIPGAQNQNHVTIEGEELASVIVEFMKDNPLK